MTPTPPRALRRLKDIIAPAGPIPVSRSTWFSWVQRGRVPPPVKLGRLSAWREADIQRLIEEGTATDGLKARSEDRS